ncbi:MAG: hypothetical protein WD061_01495 [Candidatus Saccharimonadales bacterium]
MAKKRVRKAVNKRSPIKSGKNQGTYYGGKKPPKPRQKSKFITVAKFILVISLLAAAGWFSYIDRVGVYGSDNEDLTNQIHQDVVDLFTWQWQVNDSSISVLEHNYRGKIASIDYANIWWQQELNIDITQRQPVMIWISEDESYLMDEFGVITGVLPDNSEDSHAELPVVNDDANLPIEIGDQATTRGFVEFALAIEDSEEIDVRSMRILETTSEIHADLADGYSVRFAIDEDFDQQIDNVKRVQDIAKDRGDNISSYIDVRIPYKAYYR